jgi:hypothetical protein
MVLQKVRPLRQAKTASATIATILMMSDGKLRVQMLEW